MSDVRDNEQPCTRCGEVLIGGRGGCKGAQHGRTGCAMNNPVKRSEKLRVAVTAQLLYSRMQARG
jgi:hypothetical protein